MYALNLTHSPEILREVWEYADCVYQHAGQGQETLQERKIRDMGGIGFFLGGIGPDGHIGFNIKGSDHYFTTRLCPTNYETQAAAVFIKK